jgi:hypothetical protein
MCWKAFIFKHKTELPAGYYLRHVTSVQTFAASLEKEPDKTGAFASPAA